MLRYDYDAGICRVEMFSGGAVITRISDDPSMRSWSFRGSTSELVNLEETWRFEDSFALAGYPGCADLALEFTLVGDRIELFRMELESQDWGE